MSDESDWGFFGDSKIRYSDIPIFRYFDIPKIRLGIGLLAFVFFVIFVVGI
nr:MAG TPA: hypothetical protein [Bacteriophage sp.]